jgi:hypothetical protein
MKTKSKKINPPKGGNTEQVLTKEQVEWLNKCTSGTWRLNPQTGLVDVDGDFYCYNQGLIDLKGVRFGVVYQSKSNRFELVMARGNFDCSGNQLTSLEGAPLKVGGEFNCRWNKLTSLVGAPQKVGKWFDCQDNRLTTLVGAPQVVGEYFSCDSNNLTSLVGAPQEVGGLFSCEYNQLSFSCHDNQLTSLEGAPQEVKGNFRCGYNRLTSLEGAPRVVEGHFNCYNNQLTSLEGAPRKVKGDFYCPGNPVPETTLEIIFSIMKMGKSYQEVLEFIWNMFSIEDKILLWRPEFKWVDEKEIKTLKAMGTVNKLKGMI